MRILVWRTLSVLLLLFAVGCAPGLGASLRVPAITEEEVTPFSHSTGEIRVNVGKFQDMRQPHFIGDVNGRLLEADGDVGLTVQTGFERLFSAAGARLALFNSPSIVGDVNKWYVKVNTGFPTSKAMAEADITVSVFDRDSRRVYTATYTGQTSYEHPVLSQSRIQKALVAAIGYAMRQALADERLLENLRSY